MCDSDKTKPGNGSRRWVDSPMQLPSVPAGAWIDLTWPLSPAVPRVASFPRPRIERIASIPGRPLNITELQMVVDTGTHVDSPRHFFNDGPACQNIPLARLMGPGVVWRIDQPLYGLIEIGVDPVSWIPHGWGGKERPRNRVNSRERLSDRACRLLRVPGLACPARSDRIGARRHGSSAL